MSYKLLNHRLASVIVFVNHSITIQSKFDLGNQMKLFNDKKQFRKTLELFEMNSERFSSLIITQALKACTQLGDLQRGKTIHHLISSRVKNDSYILASLIHLYMQCGDVINAESLFNISTNKSLSMYGSMMKGYIKNMMANKAIQLFDEIKNPDDVIIILLFNAYAQLRTEETLNLTKKFLPKIQKSFQSNPRLLTSLLDVLVKCGDMKQAQLLFDTSSNKILSMYGVMMNGFNLENNPLKTLQLFNQMKLDGLNQIISFILVF